MALPELPLYIENIRYVGVITTLKNMKIKPNNYYKCDIYGETDF